MTRSCSFDAYSPSSVRFFAASFSRRSCALRVRPRPGPIGLGLRCNGFRSLRVGLATTASSINLSSMSPGTRRTARTSISQRAHHGVRGLGRSAPFGATPISIRPGPRSTTPVLSRIRAVAGRLGIARRCRNPSGRMGVMTLAFRRRFRSALGRRRSGLRPPPLRRRRSPTLGELDRVSL